MIRVAGVAHELVAVLGPGRERRQPFVAEGRLEVGELVFLAGRHWLITGVEPGEGDAPARATARPARYGLVLRHADGREEAGALRRLGDASPRLGHVFATKVEGEPVSWQVVEERIGTDDHGQPYLELVAERDYGELEEQAERRLEHVVAGGRERALAAAVGREAEAALELVALPTGAQPDWRAAESTIDSLVLEEVGDDVRALCGVDPELDPPETWLATVKERLHADLERFRADVEGDRDEIEQWDEAGFRLFVSVGTPADEADADRPHGWMCRLADSGVLTAAGYARARKADL